MKKMRYNIFKLGDFEKYFGGKENYVLVEDEDDYHDVAVRLNFFNSIFLKKEFYKNIKNNNESFIDSLDDKESYKKIYNKSFQKFENLKELKDAQELRNRIIGGKLCDLTDGDIPKEEIKIIKEELSKIIKEELSKIIKEGREEGEREGEEKRRDYNKGKD